MTCKWCNKPIHGTRISGLCTDCACLPHEQKVMSHQLWRLHRTLEDLIEATCSVVDALGADTVARQTTVHTNDAKLNRRQRLEKVVEQCSPWVNNLGSIVSVLTRDNPCIDTEGPWIASCDTHSQVLTCPTKSSAITAARHSHEWCSECQATRGSSKLPEEN